MRFQVLHSSSALVMTVWCLRPQEVKRLEQIGTTSAGVGLSVCHLEDSTHQLDYIFYCTEAHWQGTCKWREMMSAGTDCQRFQGVLLVSLATVRGKLADHQFNADGIGSIGPDLGLVCWLYTNTDCIEAMESQNRPSVKPCNPGHDEMPHSSWPPFYAEQLGSFYCKADNTLSWDLSLQCWCLVLACRAYSSLVLKIRSDHI
ncbi:Carbon catabolite-derepressing protein kinase [Venturia inaequalis]|nr:Carbon catabolite-derepressing protein kinase [Venturia inaequalis]